MLEPLAMSAEAALASRTWSVGSRTVTLTIPNVKPGKPVHIAVEWSPSEPARLSNEEQREYRLGRNQAVASIAAELGVNAMVLEV